MWNDNDTKIDLIDVEHQINAVKAIIENEDLIPCTVGIFGDWGSGKSSIMRMLEEEYKKEDDYLLLKFNGWLFEGYEDAKTVLMGTIIENIIKKRTLDEKIKKKFISLLKRVDWLKTMKMLGKAGASIYTASTGDVAISSFAMSQLQEQDYESLLKEEEDGDKSIRMSIQEFHEDFEELIAETKTKRLVVFIDDLDRCSPDTIIATLEAIKLFLYVKNTVFVICADETLIEYAVRNKFPELEGIKHYASKNYLEKLVQHPIRIPRMSEEEMEIYINMLFISNYIKGEEFEKIRQGVREEKRKNSIRPSISYEKYKEIINKKIDISLEEELVLSSQIAPQITKGLYGNPRQCKRFLNMLMMRKKIAEDRSIDISKRVLSKIMLLEYFRPNYLKEIFGIVVQEQDYRKILEKVENNESVEIYSELIEGWRKDDWMKKWLMSEPRLSNEDLSPYYFLTREKLSGLNFSEIRINAKVEELYSEFISNTELSRKKALKEINKIEDAELQNLLQLIKVKIQREEDEKKKDFMIISIIKIAGKKKEVLGEVIKYLGTLPKEDLSPTIYPELNQITKGGKYQENLEGLYKEVIDSKSGSYKIAERELKNLLKEE